MIRIMVLLLINDQVPLLSEIKNGTARAIMVPLKLYGPNGLSRQVPRYHEKQLICLASYVEKLYSTFYIFVYMVQSYSRKGLEYYVEM